MTTNSNSMADSAEHAVLAAAKELQGKGKVLKKDTPIHPALVHWPVAFLSTSFILDSLTLAPSLSAKILPQALPIPVLSYYCAGLGALTAIPAIVTGLGELYAMARGQLKQKGLKQTWIDAQAKQDIAGEKLKITITHASLNDISVGIAVWNFFNRRGNLDYSLSTVNGYAAAAAIPILLYSAYLGGLLSYGYGVGVQRQGDGLRVKHEQNKEK